MFYSQKLSLLVLAKIACSLVFALDTSRTSPLGFDSHNLAADWDFVGAINGKVFLADNHEFVKYGRAQTKCHEINATLPRIESAEEDNLIRTYMYNSSDPGSEEKAHFYFLDATDYPHEGLWRWTSNNKLLSYGVFGYPGNTKSVNCAVLGVFFEDWLPTECSFPFPSNESNVNTLCQYSLS